jgi:hypothetical protein
VPPLTGVAVKVTAIPAQTGFTEAVIETLTTTLLSSIIVIVFEVAGFPVGQGTLEFNTQETLSPFAGMYE